MGSTRLNRFEKEQRYMTFLKRNFRGFRMGALLLAVQTLAMRAFAAPAGGGLPWEKPMTLIATSLTGPVAYAIGLIGICIAGGTLLFGHELGEVGRRACMLGLVVAVLIFAAPMLASAFGVGAAVV
jgi:type IV secretion system protein VirB2